MPWVPQPSAATRETNVRPVLRDVILGCFVLAAVAGGQDTGMA